MKDTKAFLNKKKERPGGEQGGREGKKEIWRDVDRGNSEKGQKKGRENSARGDTLHHRRCVGTTTSSPIRFTQGEEEEEVLLERPERGV